MLGRLKRALDALLDRPVEVGSHIITLPDGSEYVRIERAHRFDTSHMPEQNAYGDDLSQSERRGIAFQLLDDETHGFIAILLRAGENPPARLIAQVQPAWRPYVGAILGGILREFARAGDLGRPGHPARRAAR